MGSPVKGKAERRSHIAGHRQPTNQPTNQTSNRPEANTNIPEGNCPPSDSRSQTAVCAADTGHRRGAVGHPAGSAARAPRTVVPAASLSRAQRVPNLTPWLMSEQAHLTGVRRQVYLEPSGRAGGEGDHASCPCTSDTTSFPHPSVPLGGDGGGFPIRGGPLEAGAAGPTAHGSSLTLLPVLGPFCLPLEAPASPSRACLTSSRPPRPQAAAPCPARLFCPDHEGHIPSSIPCRRLLKRRAHSEAQGSHRLAGLGPGCGLTSAAEWLPGMKHGFPGTRARESPRGMSPGGEGTGAALMLTCRAGSEREGCMGLLEGSIEGRKADKGQSQGKHKKPGEREGGKKGRGLVATLRARVSAEGLRSCARPTPAGWRPCSVGRTGGSCWGQRGMLHTGLPVFLSPGYGVFPEETRFPSLPE